jgi:hypothetical protein
MLFDEFTSISNSKFTISVFWERCVALTILVRSFRIDKNDNIIRLKSPLAYDPVPRSMFNLRIMKKGDIWQNVAINELVLSPPSHPGFDGILVSNRNSFEIKEVFFLQMKIGESTSKKTKATVLATTIYYSINHYFENKKQLFDQIKPKNLHIVFYAWWDEEHLKKDDIIQAVNELSCQGITRKKKDQILSFLKGSWFDKNIHIMGKNKLDDWLIPTLTVVPRLVAGIVRV